MASQDRNILALNIANIMRNAHGYGKLEELREDAPNADIPYAIADAIIAGWIQTPPLRIQAPLGS